MAIAFDISHSNSLLEVRVIGNINEIDIKKLWGAIVEACDTHNCYDILGISELDAPFSTMDAFSHHEIFTEVGVTRRHRIAWVNLDAESREMLEFTETVLRNRFKLNGGLFPSIEAAKEWLANKGGSNAR